MKWKMTLNKHKRGYYRERKDGFREYGDYQPFKGFGKRVYTYKEGKGNDPCMIAFTAKPKSKGAKRTGFYIALLLREQGRWRNWQMTPGTIV